MEALIVGAVLVAGTLLSVRLIRARPPETQHSGSTQVSFAVQMLAAALSVALIAGLTLILDGLLA